MLEAISQRYKMLFTWFLILLLARVSSCSLDCIWDNDSGMSVGEVLFRGIMLTPFGHNLNTGRLCDLCGGVEPARVSFLNYWSNELIKRLPSCDCFGDPESSTTIGEELFREMFLTPFGLELKSHGRSKPPDAISYWQYWDDPVFIFLDFLFIASLAILVYTVVASLLFIVAEEKPKKDVGTQTEPKKDVGTQTEPKKDVGTQTEPKVSKATQTEDHSGQNEKSWRLTEYIGFTRKRKSRH